MILQQIKLKHLINKLNDYIIENSLIYKINKVMIKLFGDHFFENNKEKLLLNYR